MKPVDRVVCGSKRLGMLLLLNKKREKKDVAAVFDAVRTTNVIQSPPLCRTGKG